MEDLSDSGESEPARRQSAVETIGVLASALKAKLKHNKQPPTPPKKDFLVDDPADANGRVSPAKFEKPTNHTSKPQGHMLNIPNKTAVKKGLDRNMQPPPPAPPQKQHTEMPKSHPIVLPVKPNTEKKLSPPSTRAKPAFKPAADTNKPETHIKPKPPVKSKAVDDEADSKIDVAGLAGALKAKFEQNNSPVANKPVTTPKPKPGLAKKPSGPGLPTKPGVTPKPQMPSKPAWQKPEPGSNDSSQLETSGKVSDLASVLKAKFENRQSASDSSNASDTKPNRDIVNKPVPKPAIKLTEKPARPFSPPTPKKFTGGPPKRPVTSGGGTSPIGGSPRGGRSQSPISADNKRLDPGKYSSRPLPPSPKGKPEKPDTKPKIQGKPVFKLPVKPGKVIKDESTDSSESDSDTKASGVANLANALKNKLNHVGVNSEQKPNQQQKHSNQSDNHRKKTKVDIDIDNNNGTSGDETSEKFVAIADFGGFNDGEMKVVVDQEVELLETADEWSYVKSGDSEGWVPSSYIEKATQSRKPVQTKKSQTGSSTKKQTVFQACSDFVAEQEGELSVTAGEEVEVVEQPEGGWWFVQKGSGEDGWVPSSYITQM